MVWEGANKERRSRASQFNSNDRLAEFLRDDEERVKGSKAKKRKQEGPGSSSLKLRCSGVRPRGPGSQR